MLRTCLILALLLPISVACTAIGGEQETALPPTPATAAPAADPADPAPVAATLPPAPTTAMDATLPAAEPTPVRANLPILGPAPAWTNGTWINSEPITLADLRGKVVLLEFWTFG